MNGKLGLEQVLAIVTLKPSPENDRLYRPVDPEDPEIKKLAASIAQRGVLEPLVVTEDLFVVSGHRRLWDTHNDARAFMNQQLNGMFSGYWRNLQQSQPNHLEILGEKNTVDPIIRPIAATSLHSLHDREGVLFARTTKANR